MIGHGPNSRTAHEILKGLAQIWGVSEVILCAGARNSPFVDLLARSKGLTTHSFFEERNAGFFALGRIRRSRRPVAVITTSGTAAAELLPAAVEAHHAGDALILITADRPMRLRGSGAPQTINQIGLFRNFVAAELDLHASSDFSFDVTCRSLNISNSPVHLNVCFDEPLIDHRLLPSQVVEFQTISAQAAANRKTPEVQLVEVQKEIETFFNQHPDSVVIVGGLSTPVERTAVAEFLTRLQRPVYVEAHSGLRGISSLSPLLLNSGERILSEGLRRGFFQGVIRVGSVPTARVWRDLDDANATASVLSLSNLPFAGLSPRQISDQSQRREIGQSQTQFLCLDLSLLSSVSRELKIANERLPSASLQKLRDLDQTMTQALMNLIEQEPQSEVGMVHRLSRLMQKTDFVYLGNSLPIREWDLAASASAPTQIFANRGANGIDGQVSTFYGLLEKNTTGWAIIGDLTALYDLAGPWALRSAPASCRSRVVVINNGGGKIFSRIFSEPLFENRHQVEFSAWAQMWSLPYEKWTSIPSSWDGPAHGILELCPDADSDQRFWQAYDRLWKSQKT